VLAGVIERFHLLRFGLAAVLGFVGVKMLGVNWFHVPTAISLGVIALCLGASVVASLMIAPPPEASPAAAAGTTAEEVAADVEATGLVTVADDTAHGVPPEVAAPDVTAPAVAQSGGPPRGAGSDAALSADPPRR
jgi:hypothetical protein